MREEWDNCSNDIWL